MADTAGVKENFHVNLSLALFMKSPEQMGGPPEQPKEEPIKDREETSEKPAPPESYNEAEWEKLKQGGAAFAISKGKEMGVPQEKLDRFAQDVIARETESKNYGLAYRFRKNMGIGTEEEVRAAGEQAYKFFLESGESGSAMSIAEDIYGRGSEEWRRASKANEAEWKKTEEKRKRKKEEMEDEERELNAKISKDATFADLFSAIDAIEEEEGLGELHFEEELWDNFDSAIVEKVLAFRDVQASKAATTKVLDFFRERGYTQSDVSVFLPIKFKRERKKK
jgi:hypothetical protein